jgi:hypothetical protein
MSAKVDPPAAPGDSPAAPAGPSRKRGKLLAAAAVALLASLECVVGFLYLSSSGDETAKAEAPHADEHTAHADDEGHAGHAAHDGHQDAHGDDHGSHADEDVVHGELLEVELGAPYSLSILRPESNTTLLIDFKLYGLVRSEHQAEFAELFERSRNRIRDEVLTVVRSAEMGDFADPGLALIKRQILEKSNATLGRRLLERVGISDFTFLEQ